MYFDVLKIPKFLSLLVFSYCYKNGKTAKGKHEKYEAISFLKVLQILTANILGIDSYSYIRTNNKATQSVHVYYFILQQKYLTKT